jgi:hypothetical protein
MDCWVKPGNGSGIIDPLGTRRFDLIEKPTRQFSQLKCAVWTRNRGFRLSVMRIAGDVSQFQRRFSAPFPAHDQATLPPAAAAGR